MIHRVPHKPSTILSVSRYACGHALRKAHDSSNETHNQAICINDAPSDSEELPFLRAFLILRFFPLYPLFFFLFIHFFLALIYRFCPIAPLHVDTACDHVCWLVISLVKKKIDLGNIMYRRKLYYNLLVARFQFYYLRFTYVCRSKYNLSKIL